MDLRSKYNFSDIELQILNYLKKACIHKVVYCSEGGFDKESGEYHLTSGANIFKIKVQYEDDNSGIPKWAFFISNTHNS